MRRALVLGLALGLGALVIPSCGDSGEPAQVASPSVCADAGTCDQCGGCRVGECPEWEACQASPGCAAILACAFGKKGSGSSGCKVNEGAAGAACVAACIDTHCTSDADVAAYLAAERCAYCGDACGTVCDAYCAELPAATCGGSADAATD
ncbi:MAG: hypothetical protein IT376_10015 [Polyangiaceae bacterium]|nr:hypothetical protein [Polyangiaceae bacterium]